MPQAFQRPSQSTLRPQTSMAGAPAMAAPVSSMSRRNLIGRQNSMGNQGVMELAGLSAGTAAPESMSQEALPGGPPAEGGMAASGPPEGGPGGEGRPSLIGSTADWARDQGSPIDGMDYDTRMSACGPIAAEALQRALKNDPNSNDIAAIYELAKGKGYWDYGMMGPDMAGEKGLLTDMGIETELTWVADMSDGERRIRESLEKGVPVIISTLRHYFVASGMDENGEIFVGNTGRIMGNYGGTEKMTLSRISEVGNGSLVLLVAEVPDQTITDGPTAGPGGGLEGGLDGPKPDLGTGKVEDPSTGGGPAVPGPQQSGIDAIVPKILEVVPEEMAEYAATAVPAILRQCVADDVRDANQVAYILATAQHESRFGTPMYERSESLVEDRNPFGQEQDGSWSGHNHLTGNWMQAGSFEQLVTEYWDAGYGGRLGNAPGTADAANYRGRGYVQLTGRSNYERMTNTLNGSGFSYSIDGVTYGGQNNPPIDLLAHPDHVNRAPDLAAKVMVEGMTSGSFTGMSLGDCINNDGVDFWNARKTVNGDAEQNGDLVAGHANTYASVLLRDNLWNKAFEAPAIS